MRAITKTTISIRTKSYTKAILDMFPKLLLFGEKYAIMIVMIGDGGGGRH